ncbi:MAG: hypothetical protein HOE48_13285 [Candidatus Latescibacteria bacterium]|nr:hypothetical protein [Candidatus Latescibacterota bacterium]
MCAIVISLPTQTMPIVMQTEKNGDWVTYIPQDQYINLSGTPFVTQDGSTWWPLGESSRGLGFNGTLSVYLSPWCRYFLSHDPADILKKVICPTLAFIGKKDLQVPAKENLAAIEAAFKAGGNTNVVVTELPSLNHLFQTAQTGSLEEYAKIEETFAPIALNLISDWIDKQLKMQN